MAKVSIVVPVYNAEPYLRKCIESILHQKETDIELLLVDDASVDRSLSICNEYREIDNRVIVIAKENGGPHSARKVGVNSATSSYIAFVDADDWVADTLISSMVDDMIQYKVDCVISGYTLLEKEKTTKCRNEISAGVYGKQDMIENVYSQMLCPYNSFRQKIIPSLCVKLFKKDILIEIMNKLDDDIFIGEDLACSYNYILGSESICIQENNFDYYYCIHKNSNSNSYDANYFEKAIRLSDYLYNAISERGYSFLEENIDRFRIYQVYRQIGIAINACNNQLFKKIIKDIENVTNIVGFKEAFQKVALDYFEISKIDKKLLICLKNRDLLLFNLICKLLYYYNKRKR